jgi:hypothetical protein
VRRELTYLIKELFFNSQNNYLCRKNMKPTDKRRNNGGHKTAGRKKLADKRMQVSFYVESSAVEAFGGILLVRDACQKLISKKN